MLRNTLRMSLAGLATAVVLTAPGLAGADFYAGLKAFDAKQYSVAAREWEKSARTGDAKSAFRLGKLYQQGRGVPRNLERALFWYKVAEARGSADAGIAAIFVSRKLPAAARNRALAQARGFRPGQVAGNSGGAGGGDGGGAGGGSGGGYGSGGGGSVQMAGKELRRTFQDGQYTRSEIWRFDANGRVRGIANLVGGGALAAQEDDNDSGTWRMEGSRVCVTWRKWNNGAKTCYRLQKVGKRWKLIGSNGRTTMATIGAQ